MKIIGGMFILCLFDCVICTNQNMVFFLCLILLSFLFIILVEHLCKNFRQIIIYLDFFINSFSILFT
jgi:hypothetical protein